MRPNHNPQFREARPPASMRQLDGRATEAITRQQVRLEQSVGNVNEARLQDNEDERLYGYNFNLSNGNAVDLSIDVDAAGQPEGPDREFVDTRNRLAILRARERSRGSRMFNFAFMRNRGPGPGGHGYQLRRVQREYNVELADFVARKIDGLGLGNEDLVTEAVSRAVIQEQKQMGVLENVAAEHKSRFLNFFRNHKKSRIAAGLVLGGVGVIGVATGQLEIAIPALAARSAITATGGYLLGRTGWDAIQGRRANRLPHADIRMARANDGDFSGRLSPRAAFERFVKLHGAEARAGSRHQDRQELIQRLGAGLVHEYYTDQLDFTAGHDANAISNQVTSLHRRHINGLQERRLKSDQTQSRNRHRAGVVGAILFAGLPMVRTAGLIDLGIGEAHTTGAHGSTHNNSPNLGNGNGGSSGTNPNGSGTAAPGNSAPLTPGNANPNGISPNGAGDINIYGGNGNDTIVVGSGNHNIADLASGHSHSGGVHAHETFRGVETDELHVKRGGGFISTLRDQYDLSNSQANAAYHEMYDELHGTKGTYLVGSDIRISAPGDFHLNAGAQAELEDYLKDLNRMPEHLHKTVSHIDVDTSTPIKPVESVPVDPQTGGVLAPDEQTLSGAGSQTGGFEATTADAASTLHIEGGTGADQISVHTPNGSIFDTQSFMDAVNNHHYVPDSSINSLSPQEAERARDYIEFLIHNGSLTADQAETLEDKLAIAG